uniref:Uncharacterized protein n=1 Tax=Rhizophora mucronata TaxID=61149 RepID=A0A2P2NBC3_RHIMU
MSHVFSGIQNLKPQNNLGYSTFAE